MPQYNVPSYFKGGILPRRTEYGELRVGSVLVPKFGDVVKVIPQSEWPAIIASENKPECSSLIWNIYDQDGVGSCASESSAKMVEVIRERAGRPRVQLNPWFTYHTVSGGSDRGSTLDDNIEFLMTKGACPESVYARSKGWKPTPPAEAYKAALDYRIQEIFDLAPGSTFATEFGTALLLGFSVYFGYDSHAVLGTELISTASATPEQLACADAIDKQVDSYRAWLNIEKPWLLRDMPLGRDLDKTADNWLVVYVNSWGDWGDGRGSMKYGFGTMKFGAMSPSFGVFAARVPTEETGQ